MEKKLDMQDSLNSLMPKKRFYRSRAHCNPLSHNDSFQYGHYPEEQSWNDFFPRYYSTNQLIKEDDIVQKKCKLNEETVLEDGVDPVVRFLDIGMGFGGLTVALATLFPKTLVMGMEIRPKVCEYVRLRIEALRAENPGEYQNASCLRTNCMRYLPNYFQKSQIQKIFFCFPDPHFKAKNHRRRIVSYELLSEYAFVLAPGGRLYTITDVEELHQWHVAKCSSHPCFRQLDNDELLISDPCVKAMIEETEEGKKVARFGGNKYYAVFERLQESEIKKSPLDDLFA